MNLPRVQVLLSFYNGSKFIKEQVDSILRQEGVEVSLLIRDDGSDIEEFVYLDNISGPNIQVIKGENKGSVASFFDLINSSGDFDFYALSDQDDVWDKDKLLVAINQIIEIKGPAIYTSNARLVDTNLNFVKNEKDNPLTTLGSALVKDYATGCTAVFNKLARNLIATRTPKYTPTHDWWINLVVLSCGGVSIYDTVPHISYRQHGNNLVGAPTSLIKKWKSRWLKFKGKPYLRDVMAKELLELYKNEISDNNKKVLKSLVEYKNNKMHIVKSGDYRTGNLLNDVLFFVCLFMNKI